MAQYEIDDLFIITEPETLKVLSDPFRLEIMKELLTPKTVKEVAEKLDREPTKLYYHFKLLEKHNIIRVVETNVVSGIIEKTYLVTAHSFTIGDALFEDENAADENIDMLLSSIFDQTKIELKRNMLYFKQHPDMPDDFRGLIHRSIPNLTEAQYLEFKQKLETLLAETEQLGLNNMEDSLGTPYGFTVAIYPKIDSAE